MAFVPETIPFCFHPIGESEDLIAMLRKWVGGGGGGGGGGAFVLQNVSWILFIVRIIIKDLKRCKS